MVARGWILYCMTFRSDLLQLAIIKAIRTLHHYPSL